MVTDRQIGRLMALLQGGESHQVSADRSLMDRGTARKYRRAGQLPSALRKDHAGRTRAGRTLEHLIYHFVLPYSNWQAFTSCYSESFESLSEGLQNALWELVYSR